MKSFLRAIIIIAAMQSAVVATSNAQTISWPFNGAGSSAAYLEGGEAAASQLQSTPTGGHTFQCVWSAASKNGIGALDPKTLQPENGQSWVAWSIDPATGTDCSNPGTGAISVFTYEQTDSVVGNRLLFNGATTGLGTYANGGVFTANTPGGAAKLIYTSACVATGWDTTANPTVPVETCNLPASITTFLQAQGSMTVAGTDIRPEDAAFATLRTGGTACGAAVASGSQYLGLGYPFAISGTPSTINSFYSTGTFNVTNFTLPSSYSVFRLGAAPVVVQVNQTDGTANGFANTGITNITSGELANFLDGTYSRTQDLQGGTSAGDEGVIVLLREPLSGTFNTMEYNVPNTLENQSSMEVGLNQQSAQVNCAGGSPKNNPQHALTKLVGGVQGERDRVIGTGEMENVLFGASSISTPPVGPVLGWSFWSAPNLQGAYSGRTNYNTNARYLTVDGVDPLMASYGSYTGSSVQGVATATFAAGGSATFTGTGNISLSGFNGCSGTTALLAVSGGVAGAITVTGSGNGCTAAPTTAVCAAAGTGGSTCSAAPNNVVDLTSTLTPAVCPAGTCPAGTIPTPLNGGLTAVTMTNVINGSYPIWSFLRLVCAGSGTPACTAASGVASAAQNFVALGSSVNALHPPDFVPVTNTVNTAWNSIVVRSHFTPPGTPATGTLVGCTPVSNGTTTTGTHAALECGGDVGGVVYTIQGDIDFAIDFQSGLGVKGVGETKRRR